MFKSRPDPCLLASLTTAVIFCLLFTISLTTSTFSASNMASTLPWNPVKVSPTTSNSYLLGQNMLKSSTIPIHVATVNVYDGDSAHPVPIPDTGQTQGHASGSHRNPYDERPWSERRGRLVDALLSTGSLDIVGFQEVLFTQLRDLQHLLGTGYEHVGVGRDDGVKAGEFSPIFFDSIRFELVDWKTIWLSPTPAVPGSIGWDAGQTRIATFLTLRDKLNKNLVHVVNTHYDDRGKKARGESSLLIRKEISKWVTEVERNAGSVIADAAPVILFGDFNSPEEEDGYKSITSPMPLPNNEPSFTFLDSFYYLQARSPSRLGQQSTPYGPLMTYTGFAPPDRVQTTRIDFVMLAASESKRSVLDSILGRSSIPSVEKGTRARGGWLFQQYAVIDNWIEGADADGWTGRWSDHRAVKVTIGKE